MLKVINTPKQLTLKYFTLFTFKGVEKVKKKNKREKAENVERNTKWKSKGFGLVEAHFSDTEMTKNR